MATATKVLADYAEIVLAFLSHNHLVTRLREKSDGDHQDCPVLPVEMREAGVSPQALIATLEQLYRQDLVRRCESIHLYDSSEYAITWYLT